MRVCPTCGHADHPMWRPRASRPFCEYVKAETLEYIDSDLFTRIKDAQPEFYEDGHFIYHISRTGLNVERIERSLFDIMRWGQESTEKVDHSAMANVAPLTEYMKPDTEGGF